MDQRIVQLFQNTNICTIATSNQDKPRASVLEYAIVHKHLIFATSPNSLKVANLNNNNNISVSIVNMPTFLTLDGKTTTASP